MSKNKSKTTQNQTYSNQAQYGWQQTPDTADIAAYRNYKPEIDPSIAYGAAESKRRLNSSYLNPLGGNYSSQMQDKLLNAGNRQIDQDASQAFRLGQYDQNQQIGGQKAALASLTSPRLVQSGSSGTGSGVSNTEQGKNLFGQVLEVGQAAAGIGLG